MKRLLTIGLVLSALTAIVRAEAPAALPTAVDAKDANIQYIGRWDMTKPEAPRASWTLSTVKAKFKGTAINAMIKGGSYLQIVVDGEQTSVLQPTKEAALYEIAKGLPNKEHVVEIVRRDEAAWVEPITFLGFQLEAGGKLLPLPARSDKRILVIGDSISCGYGNEQSDRNEHFKKDKQNGYMTYGAIAARNLGAEAEIVAWSGRKLYPDNSMVELYDRTLAMDAASKTDLKSWVPGVVVINLGTNDFGNKNKMPDQKGWTDAYKAFIKTIRDTAPKAYIFVASGSMGCGKEWEAYAKQIVADLNTAGDKNVAYLPFPQQQDADGIGGDWHPSIKTHIKMADLLTKKIEEAVAWKPVAATAAPAGAAPAK
jgi:lysophospholipase L1-like esterase